MTHLTTISLAILGLGLAHESDLLGAGAAEPGRHVAEVVSPVDASSSGHLIANGLWTNGMWANGLATKNGIWNNGFWNNGLWSNGIWSNGLWSNGLWTNALWNNGIWSNGLATKNGIFQNGLATKNGIWQNGIWANGLATKNGLWGNGLSTKNGLWNNGLWANGLWANGLWQNGLWQNGLWQNGLWGNGLWANGLASSTRVAPEGLWLSTALRPEHGLSVAAGLSTDAGLSHSIGLMASEDGRRIASYAVKCALPADRTLEKYDAQGRLHAFHGAVGVAPEWEAGSCGESCQEWMSACLLAHVNLTGKHVDIWVTADHPAVKLDTSKQFPLEEAAFFGNLFAEKPEAYACTGRQAKEHPIAGRVCIGNASCPYAAPYVPDGGSCEASSACSTGQAPSGERSGYTACEVGERRFTRVVTTWKP